MWTFCKDATQIRNNPVYNGEYNCSTFEHLLKMHKAVGCLSLSQHLLVISIELNIKEKHLVSDSVMLQYSSSDYGTIS